MAIPKKLTIDIVLVGLGVVGKGVVHQLSALRRDKNTELHFELELYRVFDSGRVKSMRPQKTTFLREHFKKPKVNFVEDEDALVRSLSSAYAKLSNDPYRKLVVIECTGSKALNKLFDFCLKNRIPLITANKAFLATNLGLLDSFRKKKVPLLFEAAVGGGMLTIKLLRDTFGSDRVSILAGILNGTTNYILSAMENGAGFREARERAQQRGLAEPGKIDNWDPKADLDLNGGDVFSKISLLSRLVWGWQPSTAAPDFRKNGLHASHIRRIDLRYAKEKLGSAIRFLGVARQILDANGRRTLNIFYTPAMLPVEHELCQVRGESNALLIASDFTGTSLSVGPGAGPAPTANAIVSDLFYLSREFASHPQSLGFSSGAVQQPPESYLPLNDFDSIEFSGFYIRFLVSDEDGLVGKIAMILGEKKIGVREVLQLEHSAEEIQEILATSRPRGHKALAGDEWKYLPFAITVERKDVGSVKDALREIKKKVGTGALIAEPVLMPIMNLRGVSGWQKRGELEDLEQWSAEAAKQLRGEKLSVDLFPTRYEEATSLANSILKSEKDHIVEPKEKGEQPTSVRRIFVTSNASNEPQLSRIVKEHSERGVQVRVVDLEKAEKHLIRIDDRLLMDFAIYVSQEVGIVELAFKERGELKTTGRGYQVYGGAHLDGYIRRFGKLWAIAEAPRIPKA